MKVELLHATPMDIAIRAIRKCWRSEDKADSSFGINKSNGGYVIDGQPMWKFNLGPNDEKLIKNVIRKGHTSTLEHITYNFDIKDVSRLLLQEHARHRIASLSVESTRYTLNRLLGGDVKLHEMYVSSGSPEVDWIIEKTLKLIIEAMSLFPDIRNDQLKYAIPEAYRTEFEWSINARSLRNFLKLRGSKAAHFEIRSLARCIVKKIPIEYRIFFDDLGVFDA